MENELITKRKEGEKLVDYASRIILNKKEYDLDYKELGDFLLGIDNNYSSENMRKAYYVLEKLFTKIEEDGIKDIEDEEVLSKINEQILELKKEKVKFQDQKREYMSYLRADARFTHLVDTITTTVDSINDIKPLMVNDCERDNISVNDGHAVLTLSDWHTGISEKNYWNEVNVDILRTRVETLQNKMIKIIQTHNISTLHIEILGDMINGLIHVTTRISNEEDCINQIMIASELLSNLINNLSKYVNEIHVYSATGNHGRCVANYKESLDTENFERLIPWYLQTRLSNNEDVIFHDNEYEDNIIVYEFLNERIFAVHGHEDKVAQVISDLSSMLKIFPTELHMGHYHSYYEKEEHDMSVIVNGTASGVDKFAKKIRKTNKPSQNCMIYNSDGRECTYKIKL